MTVTLKPLGMLKNYTGGQEAVDAPAGQTVRQAIAALGIPPEVIALVIVNDAQQTKDYRLQDGDVVKLIAVIGGG